MNKIQKQAAPLAEIYITFKYCDRKFAYLGEIDIYKNTKNGFYAYVDLPHELRVIFTDYTALDPPIISNFTVIIGTKEFTRIYCEIQKSTKPSENWSFAGIENEIAYIDVFFYDSYDLLVKQGRRKELWESTSFLERFQNTYKFIDLS